MLLRHESAGPPTKLRRKKAAPDGGAKSREERPSGPELLGKTRARCSALVLEAVASTGSARSNERLRVCCALQKLCAAVRLCPS
jgi:hypothetical protein